MPCTPERAIAVARSYVGYHEGAGNSVPWLEEIFRDYPQMDRDAAWCDKFYDGCIVIASDFDYDHAEYVLCGSFDDYTPISASYYRDAGRYGHEPSMGAQIFFRNSSGICHTGIVTGFDDSTVYTIEGNKHDEVTPCQYDRDDWSIDGYGYPRYDEDRQETPIDSEDEMQGIYKPDGKGYMVWFDGTNLHALDNPDEMEAVQKFYRECTGKEIPVFEFGSPEAPWGHRFEDAVAHGAPERDHM